MAGFPKAYGTERPPAEREIRETIHARKELSILADREIVGGGKQKTIAARRGHVAAVGGKIETVGDGRTLDDFRIERGGCVAADVAEALGSAAGPR